MRYLSVEEVILVHRQVISVYGGVQGILDIHLLESAIFRPQTTIGGQEMFPEVFDKAAVLMQLIIRNHAFHDGNKRTGLLAMLMFMRLNTTQIKLSRQEAVAFARKIARNELDLKEIKETIQQHAVVIS
ncbi:MAG: death-on-curing protein [Planctomycetota bacterium]|jgi:death-on-curing protein